MHKMDAYEENSDTNSNSNEESDVEVHKVGSKDRYKKLTTQLKINGSLIEFEVDTGAELSTIPQRVHKEALKKTPILASSVVLRQYDGSILPIKGEIAAQVSKGEQTVSGRFVIVKNADSQLPLLGRDWLYRLRLDWPQLLRSCKGVDPRIHTLHSANWRNEFPEVVKEGLGRLKGIKAVVELKNDARPHFCKCRPVPFALRTQVEEAIRQQVKEGELRPVEQSE